MNTTERILKMLEQTGKSDVLLIKEIGLSNGVIYQWKKGLQKPSVNAIVRIADYFNVSTDYLLGRENLISAESTDLSQDERQLLTYFKQCDVIDQARILAYAEAIAQKEVYNNFSLEKVKKY